MSTNSEVLKLNVESRLVPRHDAELVDASTPQGPQGPEPAMRAWAEEQRDFTPVHKNHAEINRPWQAWHQPGWLQSPSNLKQALASCSSLEVCAFHSVGAART